MKVQCKHTRLVPVGELKPHPKNPNEHPAKQIKLLAKILKGDAWRHPIIVSNQSGFIVVGHARLQAAQLNGWPTVPVDFQDFESDEAELAFLVADNEIPEFAERDADKLQSIIAELEAANFDTELAGILKATGDGAGDEGIQLPGKSIYEVVIECEGEAQQKQIFERLKSDKLNVRLLTL